MGMTNYKNGIISMGVPVINSLGIGNVYHVIKSTEAFYEDFRKKRQTTYSDGSVNIHSAIQSALDATVECRNDYVVVYPSDSDFDLTTALTMTKKSVHLVCPAGMTGTIGATNAVRVDAQDLTTAGTLLTISDSSCEVAGFYFKGDTDKTVIDLTALAHTSNIHHNTIGLKVLAGASTVYGIYGTGETSGVMIYNNFVTIMYPDAATKTIGGGIVLENGTRALIENNLIAVGGFGDTMSVGISAGSGAVSLIKDNYLVENMSGTGTASTFTVGIQISAGGAAIGNRGCMTTPNNLLAGGTASKTAVDNWGSAAGNTIQDAG